MEKRIAKKYAKLNQACNRYPEIVLSCVEEQDGYLKRGQNAKAYVQRTRRAKDGFVEKFCL